MDPVTVLIGVAALSYGIYTLYARRRNPQAFWKLEPMKRMYGAKAAMVIHFIGYTIVPLVIGIVAIIAGVRGVSFF